jgi:HlyD family secretion protein
MTMDVPRAPTQRHRRRLLAGAAGACLLVGLGVGSLALRPAAPSVDRDTLWLGTVQRGPMVREVLGQGTLVPEAIYWLTARSSAQVVRVLQKPGALVKSDTLIVELTNAELELAALEAERELSRAEAELVNLEATLNAERLGRESALATLTSELADAVRRARADEELGRRGFLSELEQGQTLGHEKELRGRLDFEQKRLGVLARGMAAQVDAQKEQIERLRSIAEFKRNEVEALRLRAGVDGVLQELSLEQGQSVAAGALLGKVVRPDRLKAVVRIPETQTRDLAIGQAASIDTRNGVVAGHVTRIDPAAQAGSVRVDVTLDGALPPGSRPDLNVEGRIELERLPSVLFVGRPAVGQPGTSASLFRLDADGSGAERIQVQLGRSSVENVEVLSGLREGDRVILSELSQLNEVDRIRLD